MDIFEQDINESFEYYLESFMHTVDSLSCQVSDEITIYMESINYDEDIPFIETKGDSIFVAIKKFIANLIVSVENFGKNLKNEIERKKREITLDKNLKSNYNKFLKMKEEGIKTVEVTDYWTLSEDYLKCVKRLQYLSSKFSITDDLDSRNFKSMEELEDTLEKFHSVCDEYDKILQADCEKKVSKPIDEVIRFFDKEISGSSRVLASLYDGIAIYKKIQTDCEALEKRKEILGPDIIPKHIGLLKRIAIRLSRLFGKWTTKILTGLCVIMG